MLSFLYKLSIRSKISLITVVAVLGFMFSFILSYQNGVKSVERLVTFESVNLPVINSIGSCRMALIEIKKIFNNAVSSAEASMVHELAKEQSNKMKAALDKIQSLDHGNKYGIEKTKITFESYYQKSAKMVLSMIDETIDYETLGDQIDEINSLYSQLDTSLKKIQKQDEKDFYQVIDQAKKNVDNSNRFNVLISLVVVTLTVMITYLIAATVRNSLIHLSTRLHDLAHGGGDLTADLTTREESEIGLVVHEFNAFRKKLHEIVSETVCAASILKMSTHQVAKEADLTQEGMNIQHTEINEMTTAFDAMKSATSDIAHHAVDAANYAEDAVTQTKQGCDVLAKNREASIELKTCMEKTHITMSELAEESESIGAVLDVIRGVAEQTNLLALNAAIEAARAGEQGRGFAVVADEVRTLAGRTQQSTSEIQKIIFSLQEKARGAVEMVDLSQQQVIQTTRFADEAESIFNLIDQAVDSITQANISMASASEEQSVVAEDIAESIAKISETTNTTLTSATQVKQNSHDLSTNSENLENMVSKFNV